VRILTLLALTVVLLGACASSVRTTRQVTAVDAVAVALDAAEGRIQIRYNPAQCACAPFEVRTAEGWVRGDFAEADEEEALDALLAQAESDSAQGKLAEYGVLASLVTTTPSYCQNRVPYASLRLEK
jgi:hypothetical protein